MTDLTKYTQQGISGLALTLTLLFNLMNCPVNGQGDTLNSGTRINGQYFLSYWQDTRVVATEPFRWKGKQWATFAGVIGVGAITYAFDQEVYDFFQQHRTPATESISRYALEPWGSGLYSLPLLAGIYIAGGKSSRHKRIALTGIKAYLLSGGAAAVSKHLFHRHRPHDDDPPNPDLWEGPFPLTFEHTSFPSGHATTAFAVATVLAMGYHDKIWVGITSYTLAGLTALSRVHDGKHWGSDVVAGAALGCFIGAALNKINLKHIEIGPAGFQGGQGLRIIYSLN